MVRYVKTDILPLAQPDKRCGQDAVHGDGMTGAPANREGAVGDPEVNIVAGERGGAGRVRARH